MRGNRLEHFGTVVVAEEVQQVKDRTAVMVQCRRSETAHIPEELEIGPAEGFGGARLHHL